MSTGYSVAQYGRTHPSSRKVLRTNPALKCFLLIQGFGGGSLTQACFKTPFSKCCWEGSGQWPLETAGNRWGWVWREADGASPLVWSSSPNSPSHLWPLGEKTLLLLSPDVRFAPHPFKTSSPTPPHRIQTGNTSRASSIDALETDQDTSVGKGRRERAWRIRFCPKWSLSLLAHPNQRFSH